MVNSRKELLLIGEAFSPWTQKARWALEFCGLAFDYQEYIPTLSEPGLRWRLKQWSGSVSVPILVAADQTFRGSWAIADFANDATDDKRLGDMHAIAHWNELSEAALAEGRTRVVRCIKGSEQALKESLPSFVPGPLRGAMRFVARDAVKRLDRKYADLVQPGALCKALAATREQLAAADNDYLLGDFSYADIVMAVVLEVVAPIADVQPPLGPATRRCWHDSALASEYQDLLDWRRRLASNPATSYSQLG